MPVVMMPVDRVTVLVLTVLVWVLVLSSRSVGCPPSGRTRMTYKVRLVPQMDDEVSVPPLGSWEDTVVPVDDVSAGEVEIRTVDDPVPQGMVEDGMADVELA